jgi:uncharacterized protein
MMKTRALLIGITLVVGLVSISAMVAKHGLTAAKAQVPPSAFKIVKWEDLIPKDWRPPALGRGGLGALSDLDPKADELMREMQAQLDAAPTVTALNNSAIKIAGYLVPLDESKSGLKEFLLVPYFGACVHTPPPPGNQIIHVFSAKPVAGFRSMDVVWVSGTLKTSRQTSEMGNSGYRLNAVAVTEYTR